MTNKLVLAAVLAALTGGVAATSAQAAPITGPLAEKSATNVQAVHYNYRQRPWWWRAHRYDNDYGWRKPWWKRHQGRDWSSRDDDRRGNDRDRDRDYRRW